MRESHLSFKFQRRNISSFSCVVLHHGNPPRQRSEGGPLLFSGGDGVARLIRWIGAAMSMEPSEAACNTATRGRRGRWKKERHQRCGVIFGSWGGYRDENINQEKVNCIDTENGWENSVSSKQQCRTVELRDDITFILLDPYSREGNDN